MRKINLVLIVGDLKKDNVSIAISQIKKILDEKNIEYVITRPVYYNLETGLWLTDLEHPFRWKNFDLIIPVGGDGTFLFTARTFFEFDIPVLGVNAGRLGFLMEVFADQFSSALEKIEKGKMKVKERILLQVTVIRNNRAVFHSHFLNDVVISKGILSRMVEISVSIDREPLAEYRADGLIVSTPTGSTAYNLSAGGPILTQDVNAMILTPICPHSLGVRPIVTSIEKQLQISFLSGGFDTNLTIDGQENFLLNLNDIIIVKKGKKSVKIYDYGEKEFFHILREKLGWHI